MRRWIFSLVLLGKVGGLCRGAPIDFLTVESVNLSTVVVFWNTAIVYQTSRMFGGALSYVAAASAPPKTLKTTRATGARLAPIVIFSQTAFTLKRFWQNKGLMNVLRGCSVSPLMKIMNFTKDL